MITRKGRLNSRSERIREHEGRKAILVILAVIVRTSPWLCNSRGLRITLRFNVRSTV